MRDLGSTIYVLGLLLNALEGEFVQTIEIVEVGARSRVPGVPSAIIQVVRVPEVSTGYSIVAYLVFSVGDHPTGYGSVGNISIRWAQVPNVRQSGN